MKLLLPVRLLFAALVLGHGPFLSTALAGESNGKNEGETVADAAVAENSAMSEIEDVPGLPRVLLIGDSISIAYTLPVRKLLEGKANVHRIPVNGQNTANGLKHLDNWLGSGKWDVIHFNFGLWDSKFRGEGAPEDSTQVSREDYKKNLLEIVRRLQATGANLVFATTTPVPAVLSPPTRRFDNIAERNEIAVKVMKENDVTIDDLYVVILPQQAQTQRPKDVHFDAKGSAILAESVRTSIEARLPKR